METTEQGYSTMAEIKAANKEAGFYFFERDTMRFFDSRVESKRPLRGRYFITSEQFHGSDGYSAPRAYTVREIDSNGNIDTVGEFQQFATYQDARSFIDTL